MDVLKAMEAVWAKSDSDLDKSKKVTPANIVWWLLPKGNYRGELIDKNTLIFSDGFCRGKLDLKSGCRIGISDVLSDAPAGEYYAIEGSDDNPKNSEGPFETQAEASEHVDKHNHNLLPGESMWTVSNVDELYKKLYLDNPVMRMSTTNTEKETDLTAEAGIIITCSGCKNK